MTFIPATTDAFRNIAVVEGTFPEATTTTVAAEIVGDTLTITGGFGITLTADPNTDSIIINNTGDAVGAYTEITDANANATYYPVFSRPLDQTPFTTNPVTGEHQLDTLYIDFTTTPLEYNPSTSTLTALNFAGSLSGAVAATTFTSNTALVGSSANFTRFPGALAVFSTTDVGIQQNESLNIGLIAEATGNGATYGAGLYGVGYTSVGARGTGVIGEGHVSASSDSASAIGVRGYSNDTHASGLNVGLYADASGSSVGNYALYINSGDINTSNTSPIWLLRDNQATALTFDSAGKTGILKLVTTDAGEGVTMSGTLSVTGHTTFEGVTSTGATGTGKIVYDNAPTITGHPTVEGVTSTGATGTGKFVFDGSPTLVTPTLGVASATSINKMAITAPATSSTLAVADGKTFTVSNTLTLTGTDSSSVAFGSGGTVAYTANKLSAFAATTSSELAGVISDETGSGALVFGTSPTISGHPTIEGVTSTGATGTGNLVFSASPTLSGTASVETLNLTNALAITYGGTGATSASGALTNLLPSGATSGYILKTSGPGSYYWAAETGASTVVGTKIDTSRVEYTATAGQTLFEGVGTYTIGTGQLRVYIDGVRQFPAAYTETSTTSFTLSTGVPVNTKVLAEVDGYKDFTVVANAVTFSPVGAIAAVNVQDALAELDTEKAPLASPTFTGTVSGITATMVGLGNVTNESKATMFASPTFTGTVSGVTATHVGLGNVTNESKATMFTSPAFTGTASSAGMTIAKETTINTATPGLGSGYGLHFNGQATNDSATGITFSAGSATAGNANAGIYVQGSGSYGTKMYIATTDSYATGSKTAISIQQTGYTKIERSSLEIATSLGVGTSGSGTTGEIRATNNITAYYSDDRLKTKLGLIENALDKIDALSGFYYEANDVAQALGYKVQREVGVSAQQTESVMPEIVAPAPIDDKYLTVRYEKFAPLLIEGIKELRRELKDIKKHLGI